MVCLPTTIRKTWLEPPRWQREPDSLTESGALALGLHRVAIEADQFRAGTRGERHRGNRRRKGRSSEYRILIVVNPKHRFGQKMLL